MSKKIKIGAVVGPTASGKSRLALSLAKAVGGEIISCDSMQIYRGMNIGTATVGATERASVPHHMTDIVSAGENFSAADYVTLAKSLIEDIHNRGALPIFCGGTGLYLDGVLRRESFSVIESDPVLREELYLLADERGNEYVHSVLLSLDPKEAEKIHPNNLKRVVRAIEICKKTGQKKSELDEVSRRGGEEYDSLIVGLMYSEREVLYKRIGARVDAMMADGLLDEVNALYKAGVFDVSLTAAQAIGYKELLGYIRGGEDLSTAVENIKLATRRYAKRQMTYFGAKRDIVWFDMSDPSFDGSDASRFEIIVNNVIKLFQEREFGGIIT